MSFSFSPPQLIGLGHPVMRGAYTATIPPGSRLSAYRLLAGVYYAEGRCQSEGRGGERGGGEGRWKTEWELGGGNVLTAHSYGTTITPSELLWNTALEQRWSVHGVGEHLDLCLHPSQLFILWQTERFLQRHHPNRGIQSSLIKLQLHVLSWPNTKMSFPFIIQRYRVKLYPHAALLLSTGL